jgi:two-component system cell cycle response regulator
MATLGRWPGRDDMPAIATIRDIDRARQTWARADMRRDPVLRRAAWAGVGWLALWVALSLAAAPQTTLGDIRDRGLYTVPVIVGLALAVVAAVRSRSPSRQFWTMLAAASACSLLGNLGDAWVSLVSDTPAAENVVAALYLVAYVFLLPALGAGLRGRFPGSRLRASLDALLVLFCLSACASIVLIAPEVSAARSFVDLSSVAFPLLDACVVTLVIGLGLSGSRLPVVLLVVAGAMALNAVADSGSAYLTVWHVSIEDRAVNALYQVGLVALALAALIAIRHEEPEPAAGGRPVDRAVLLILLTLAALVAALASTTEGGSLPVSSAVVGTIAAGLLTARTVAQSREHRLVAERLSALLREQELAASADGLTGLSNRRVFEEALSAELHRSRRRGYEMGLLMIDLDHFKTINDRFGHAAGDEVLRETAARLAAAAREEDTVARYGGEEFVVMLPELGHDDLGRVAERFRRAFADRPFDLHGGERVVTASVGAVAFPGSGDDAAVLVEAADAALYAAKRAGRDRIVVGAPVALAETA